jgi:hypothetical protein
MIDEYGAFGGMRISRETEVLRENMTQRHIVHHKSHMTCGHGPPRCEAGD